MTTIPAATTTTEDRATGRWTSALTLRRNLGVACLPGLFLIMIVGTAIDPLDDDADSVTTFSQATGHLGAIHALAWLELLAAPVCAAGLLTLVGAIRGRGAGWANAAGVFGMLAAVGQAVIGLNHLVVVGLSRADLDRAQRVGALDAFHDAGGPLPILFFLLALALPLAAVAAWRAGLAPKAILVPSLLFLLTAFLPSSGAAEYVPLVVGLVLGGWLARGLVVRD